jgi:hypothetical protein
MKFLNLIAFVTAMFLTQVASAETQVWTCGKNARDIPAGYYVKAASIVHNNVECRFDEHKVLIAKLDGQPTLNACDFQNIGTPAGYILQSRGISQTCGCVILLNKPGGERFCVDGKMTGYLAVRKQ